MFQHRRSEHGITSPPSFAICHKKNYNLSESFEAEEN